MAHAVIRATNFCTRIIRRGRKLEIAVEFSHD